MQQEKLMMASFAIQKLFKFLQITIKSGTYCGKHH